MSSLQEGIAQYQLDRNIFLYLMPYTLQPDNYLPYQLYRNTDDQRLRIVFLSYGGHFYLSATLHDYVLQIVDWYPVLLCQSLIWHLTAIR